jgi:hypothetical protein
MQTIKILTNRPSYVPSCPNHSCPLEGCGFPLPAKGTGKCPVSGADFDFEVEVDEAKITKDKDGKMVKGSKWKLTGNE